jgi:DNA invertase Pin-like site-specific DNA recombinase
MTRVAIYARTSRQEREAEGSIPVQIADCKERAESKAWDIVNVYTDPAHQRVHTDECDEADPATVTHRHAFHGLSAEASSRVF